MADTAAAAPEVAENGLATVPALETLPNGREVVADAMAFKSLEKSTAGLVNEHKVQIVRTTRKPAAFALVVHPR